VTRYLASTTDGANFTVYEGSGVTTSVRVERPSMGDDKYYHGYFDGLGAGIKWKTENYDGKFCTTDKIYIVKLDTDGKTVSASKKISDIIGAIRSDDAGKTKNLGTNVI
ncbi:MAG: hypothetical protein MJ052_02565, partial [Sphaerochaetaceae bacterium]|nr:hypothetical protein [Sphaerochaetaceae bacterium]